MITLLQPAPVDEIDHDEDSDECCIYCLCRPDVSLCGAFDDGPFDPADRDLPDCPGCRAVGVCPNCGCREGNACDLCVESWEASDVR